MPTLNSILSKTTTTTVDYDGTKIEVTYITDFLTPAVERIIKDNEQSGTPLAANVKVLASALVDWDVTDDAGNKIKPTEEVLSDLGGKFQVAVINALMGAVSPPQ